MGDRVKGITIEIDGETKGLSKALQGVNKDIKTTQTQLKDIEKLSELSLFLLEGSLTRSRFRLFLFAKRRIARS